MKNITHLGNMLMHADHTKCDVRIIIHNRPRRSIEYTLRLLRHYIKAYLK